MPLAYTEAEFCLMLLRQPLAGESDLNWDPDTGDKPRDNNEPICR